MVSGRLHERLAKSGACIEIPKALQLSVGGLKDHGIKTLELDL